MHRTPGVRLAAAVVIAVAALGAAACSDPAPPPERTVTTTDLLGRPLVEVYSDMGYMLGGPGPRGLGIVTYEMGPPVTGKPAAASAGDPSVQWVTVAACYTDNPRQLTLGVIPMSDSTPQIVQAAKTREYDRFVRECPGTATTFTAPPAA